MEMTREQSDKLKRYFINADPFMWGILEAKNKRGRLQEMQELGFLASYSKSSNPVYRDINRELLIELGITGILEKIVLPRISSYFRPEILQYFRNCWEQGQTPGIKFMKDNNLYRNRVWHAHEVHVEKPWYGRDNPAVAGYRDPAFIFIQINTQFDFVERWTVFAGLWFEEIEPLL
jgi:hypothetical protein